MNPVMNETELKSAIDSTTGPRVTESYIDSRIAKVEYQRWQDTTTTLCVITLDNGYTVWGQSACAAPENYNEGVGQTWAYKDAYKKIWPLFGFLIAEDLWSSKRSGSLAA